MARGRALDENDLRASAKVALVGQTVAQMLFGGTDPTGQTVRVKYVPFTIVGLLDAKGQSYTGQDQDDVILIPLGTARGRILGQAQGRLRTVGHINVKMAEGTDMKTAESQVRELLRQRHRLQPEQDDDFNIRNLSEVVQAEQAARNGAERRDAEPHRRRGGEPQQVGEVRVGAPAVDLDHEPIARPQRARIRPARIACTFGHGVRDLPARA